MSSYLSSMSTKYLYYQLPDCTSSLISAKISDSSFDSFLANTTQSS